MAQSEILSLYLGTSNGQERNLLLIVWVRRKHYDNPSLCFFLTHNTIAFISKLRYNCTYPHCFYLQIVKQLRIMILPLSPNCNRITHVISLLLVCKLNAFIAQLQCYYPRNAMLLHCTYTTIYLYRREIGRREGWIC